MRRRLNPFHLAFSEWLAIVTVLAIFLAVVFEYLGLPHPHPALTQAMVQVIATLLVGWIVEAVWMASRLERTGDDRENWVGSMAGLGCGGMVGLVIALLVTAHLEAGHANFLDWLGLWWSATTIGALGFMLALHPVIVERWTSKARES